MIPLFQGSTRTYLKSDLPKWGGACVGIAGDFRPDVREHGQSHGLKNKRNKNTLFATKYVRKEKRDYSVPICCMGYFFHEESESGIRIVLMSIIYQDISILK